MTSSSLPILCLWACCQSLRQQSSSVGHAAASPGFASRTRWKRFAHLSGSERLDAAVEPGSLCMGAASRRLDEWPTGRSTREGTGSEPELRRLGTVRERGSEARERAAHAAGQSHALSAKVFSQPVHRLLSLMLGGPCQVTRTSPRRRAGMRGPDGFPLPRCLSRRLLIQHWRHLECSAM